jgi:hypothetical protein
MAPWVYKEPESRKGASLVIQLLFSDFILLISPDLYIHGVRVQNPGRYDPLASHHGLL